MKRVAIILLVSRLMMVAGFIDFVPGRPLSRDEITTGQEG